MKYKYKLKQSSYYTSNGCDCCEDDYNEVWDITRTCDDGTEMELNTNGTPHSLEDCYEAICIDAGIDLEIEWEEDLD
jgi:hypothetical protein